LWLGLAAFVDHDSLAKIQDGMQGGLNMFGTALLAAIYAWAVHRQSQGVKILKAQLDDSNTETPEMVLDSGAVGAATLQAGAAVSGVSIAKAARSAGVTLR
jgi:hypothetical protein